ncbi:hypothetical protein [uncultured Sphingomonas sp.]|uniref:hypothetical protein n=1 Tax=uncultured Sphingomonas sp. TaxID=158754 RepID=UPI0026221373|nr:hypothetical protein [uncultured Sphingomonas sp.]
MLVIGARLKPMPDRSSGIAMAQIGHTTVDFHEIGVRAADFGVMIGRLPLRLQRVEPRERGDHRHHRRGRIRRCRL